MIFANGELRSDREINAVIAELEIYDLPGTLSGPPLEADTVLDALEALGAELDSGALDDLIAQYAPPGAREELAQVRRELQTAEDDVNFYRDKVLDSDDLTDLAQLVDSYISGLRDKVKAAEAAILEYAEHPETTTFVDAVRGRKNLAKAIEYYQALAQRIKHAQIGRASCRERV